MNVLFFALVALSFCAAAFHQIRGLPLLSGDPAAMAALSAALVESAGKAVELALGMIGVTAFFLGLMKVAEAAGLLHVLARLLRPLMVRLFPEIPPEHPAMGAMILNVSANVLGLGNAATPFGLKAMQELDRLNPHKGTATDAMVLFLAINTSSVTLLPTSVIALRAASGSLDAAGIIGPTLIATCCSTLVAVLVAKLGARYSPPLAEARALPEVIPQKSLASPPPDEAPPLPPYPLWVSGGCLAALCLALPLLVLWGKEISPWILPLLTVGLLGLGLMRGVAIYEAFVDGAREGFEVSTRIIPYLVAILVAVGLFRASGAMDWLIQPLSILTAPLGLPAEALPMALLRPLSGSGAYGIMAALFQDPTIGPDSYTGYLVSVIQGSTETTFYVLAVYFGSVNVRRTRHALAAGLAADMAGLVGAVIVCRWMFP